MIAETAKVAAAATGVAAPSEIKKRIIAIIKYVHGSIVVISFLFVIIYNCEHLFRTTVRIIAHKSGNCKSFYGTPLKILRNF